MKKIAKNLLKILLCFLGGGLILVGVVGIILCFRALNLFTVLFCAVFTLLFLSSGIILLYKGIEKPKKISTSAEIAHSANRMPISDVEISYSIQTEQNNIQTQYKKTPKIIAQIEEDQSEENPDQQENNHPSSDYIKTIFLHLFEKHPYKENDSFPGYFNYEYGIINMPMYFNEIKDEGLIRLSNPEEILNLMKVIDLKNILNNHNLKKSGNKSELIKRICSNVDINEIPIMNEQYFSLTQKGEDFINKHLDYIELKQHSEWNISFWEYQSAKNNANELIDFYDIILSLLNKKIMDIKKHRFNISQYEYFQLLEYYLSAYSILKNKGCYENALKALLSNVLLSVSGCQNYWLINYKKNLNLRKQQVMTQYSSININTYVAQCVRELKNYYNLEIAKFSYDNFIGPYNLCSFQMFCEILHDIFNCSILDLSKYDIAIKEIFSQKLN